MTDAIERWAIVFRRATKRKLPDAIIAATALSLKAQLLTHDTHLPDFPALKTVSTRV